MDFAAVMQEVSDRLDTIPNLRCWAYDAPTVVPPAAVVSYPEEIDPHGTYHRGMAFMKLQVMIVVGKPGDRTTRDRASVWANDSGASSVVEVLEDGAAYTAFDELIVTKISFDAVSIADVTYMAIFFDLDVAGSGV